LRSDSGGNSTRRTIERRKTAIAKLVEAEAVIGIARSAVTAAVI